MTFLVLTHYFMSILWKMAVFIEKSLVTSSYCYKTIKPASILIKLGTNIDWTIAFATTCSILLNQCLIFLLPWLRGDISKLPKITILRWFFPSKLILKCCNFLMDWDRVKCFSALVTRYLMIDVGLFLASHKSKIFLAMRSFGWGDAPKSGHFLAHLSQSDRVSFCDRFSSGVRLSSVRQ
jgi:hypothetical protein